MQILILFTIWYLIGVASFIFWWTKDYDLEVEHLFLSLAAGIIGPLAFLFGWRIHGDFKFNLLSLVVMKKRTK